METTLKTTQQHWDTEIKPQDRMFRLHLKDVWNYRDLLVLLVRRDFVSFYKQTIFGPLWFFIQPIFTTLIYTFIFGRMARLSTEGAPPVLFYLSGIIAWNYFAECLTKTSTVFRDNANIFGKVYFPRLIMPLSIIVSNLVKFGVQMLLLVAILLWHIVVKGNTVVHPNLYLLLLPVVVVLMALTGLGIGLVVTAMTTKYRDLAFLVTFGVQLAMYASPVIYSLSSIPEKYRDILKFNPLGGLIETFRLGFLGTGRFYGEALLYSAAFAVVICFIGVLVFNKVEKNFVDTV